MPDSPIAHDRLLDRFLDAPAQQLGESSRRTYRSVWNRYGATLARLGRDALQADAGAIEQFLADIGGKAAEPSALPDGRRRATDGTRRRYLELLKRVYDELARANLVAANPADALLPRVGRAERAPPVALPEAMRERLLEQLLAMHGAADWRRVRDATALWLVLDCGLRPAEVVGLETTALGPDPAPAQRALPEAAGPSVIRLPGRPQVAARVVAVPPACAEVLAHWLAVRAEAGIPGNVVFPAIRAGTPMEITTFYRAVRAVYAQAGIDRRHLGAMVLRHTHAIRALSDGASVEAVRARLGVRSRQTLARYRHWLPDHPELARLAGDTAAQAD